MIALVLLSLLAAPAVGDTDRGVERARALDQLRSSASLKAGAARPPIETMATPLRWATAFGSVPSYDLERSALTFGELTPDVDHELPAALVIRVYSERDWVLRLSSGAPFEVVDRGEMVPSSRLEYRTAGSGGYQSFAAGAPVILASGVRTTGAGELVVVDLRLRLASSDPLGTYRCSLRLAIDEQ